MEINKSLENLQAQLDLALKTIDNAEKSVDLAMKKLMEDAPADELKAVEQHTKDLRTLLAKAKQGENIDQDVAIFNQKIKNGR